MNLRFHIPPNLARALAKGTAFLVAISYTVAVCDCVFLLYDFLSCRRSRRILFLTRFFFLSFFLLTQSQSATVYFFCTISYTVAVCDCVFLLYDFFLLLLTQSQSATVYFFCTISFFFFCQHFKVLYLRHDLTDFDQTWSQVPVDHPIYVTWPD